MTVTASPSNAHPLQESVATESSSVWPTDMDLQLILRSNRLMLTMQNPLIQAVIQNTFDNVRGSILFEHAFLDVVLALSFIHDALISAAARYGPAAGSIHMRLKKDTEYMTKIVPLVSKRNFKDDITNIT